MSERLENPGPGIHRGISYDEYAAWPGIRKSSLFTLVTDTPAHYRYKVDNPEPPTPAMLFGTAVHTRVLEPERFSKAYGRGPINPKTERPYGADTLKALAWKKETGKEMISDEDLEKVEGMTEAIFNHEAAKAMLSKAETEISMMWEDEATGVLLQGRDDIWIEDVVLFGDLKSAASAHPRAFAKACVDYGYFMQAAMYYDGARVLTGKEPYKPQFVVVEKAPPFVVAVYQVELSDLEYGREQYRFALRTLGQCELEKNWPAYPEVQSLVLPKWATSPAAAV